MPLRRSAVANVLTVAAQATALGVAAASLAPGQSVRFGSISEAILEPDGADFIKYGSSGVWDPWRREVRWIGRRESINFRYRGLRFGELANSWSNDWALWSSDTVPNGHGYDHNTIDPATGDHYFKIYNSGDIWKWTAATEQWSAMPSVGSVEIAGSLEWVVTPGFTGLTYNDRRRFKALVGGTWIERENYGSVSNAYHTASAFNPIAQAIIFGGGNVDNHMRMMNSAGEFSAIPNIDETDTINPGSSEEHGVLTASASTADFIVWKKNSQSWRCWRPGDSAWTALTQSTGDGSTPQTGMPNLDDSASGRPCIGIPISTYGVTMYVQSPGSGGEVWLSRFQRPVP